MYSPVCIVKVISMRSMPSTIRIGQREADTVVLVRIRERQNSRADTFIL